MTSQFTYDFEWDPEKARTNATKHGVAFEQAAGVFRDPLALTVFDGEHSESEERWVTLGCAENGMHLVMIHTYQETGATSASVRIISARRATKEEIRDYEQRAR
ncbi:MAG: BrnT family toxin [Burkholderiales bacterium]